MLPSRATPESFFEWYDRVGRPTLRNVGVALVALWGCAIVIAAFRSALLGVSMPDMTAGCVPLLVGLAMPAVELITRHREVMSGGGQNHVPFIPESPQGGLVNNQAIT